MFLNGKEKQIKYARILSAGFPSTLFRDLNEIANILPKNKLSFTRSSHDSIFVYGEKLHIPYRIYANEPDSHLISSLSSSQYSMLCCIYTRHNNGFVRQKYAEKCLALTDPWIPAYLLYLLGEYVLEIIIMLQQHLDQITTPQFMDFILENPEFSHQITQRIVSYWDCYYRTQYPNFRDYPGFIVANYLNMWNNKMISKIIKS